MNNPAADFLLGVLCAMFGVAVLYFFKFWRRTGDRLFLAFAVAFLIEGSTRLRLFYTDNPGDAGPSIYIVRLLGSLIVLAAIADKNRRRGPDT